MLGPLPTPAGNEMKELRVDKVEPRVVSIGRTLEAVVGSLIGKGGEVIRSAASVLSDDVRG